MRRYARKKVDFARINAELLKDLNPRIIAIDGTTIQKSGEHTFGLGKFWSSCDGKAVRGIEYSCVALINPDLPGAYHLSTSQNPPDGNRVDFDIRQIQTLKQYFPDSAKHIVADGYYAKIKFCKAFIDLGLYLITKLRKDVHFDQPSPPKTGKKGRPRSKGDRVLPQDLENTIALSNGLTLKYQVIYAESFVRSCLVVAVFHGENLRMN
jgi:hypothetical protein